MVRSKKKAPLKVAARVSIRKDTDSKPTQLVDDALVMSQTDSKAKIRVKKR